MKIFIRHFSLLVLTCMLATSSALAIERDSTGVYLIGSTADYEEFCDYVNKGNSFASARVIADGINVTRSIGVGTREYHFRGKFDGQGHTLTLNGVPLFEHTQHGCEIRNVNLTGNVTNTGEYAGSLIAYSESPTIENCNSNIVINATGAVKVGGLIGYSRGTVTLNGCSFTGQVIGAEDNAGLIGWSEHTAIIKRCQVVGAKFLVGNLLEEANIVENTQLDDAKVTMTVKTASAAVADSVTAMKKANANYVSSGTATIDGITYSLSSEGKATVTDVSSSMHSVKVPSTVNWNGTEYTVVAVSSMNNGKSMEVVEIPNTVGKIHNDAFHDCEKLEEVIFADGSTTLNLGYNDYPVFDEQLFEYCPITSVYIGRNLSWDKSEDAPFQTRNKLKYIEFGPLVTVVGNCNGGSEGENELFYNCNNVAAYYFYGNEQSLGTEITFYCCEGMSAAKAAYISRDLKASKYTEYTVLGSGWGISDNLIDVKYGPYATYVTAKMYSGNIGTPPNNILKTLNFDEATRLTTVKERAFADCDKLESVNFINTNLKTIEAEGFYDCDQLANVTFSPVLEKIGRSAFDDTHIINISLPATLKTLGYKAFYDCDEAISLSFSPSDEKLHCEMEDGMCNTFTDCGELIGLYLSRNIYWDKECEKGSPFYDSYFTNVVIDDNVHHLGNYLFQHSNKLKALSIGKSVSSIPNECFNDTEEVQSLILVDNEEPITLGSSFKDFRVRSLYMGRPITDIKNIPCAPENEERTMELLQVGSNVSTIESGTFHDYKLLKTVTLPANITVKGNAFSNCGIEELYVQGDAKLESAAFSKCDKIKEVTVIGKLTMDMMAFSPSSEEVPAIQNLNVFFKEDPKDESHAQAFPQKFLNETTLNNLYDTPYQKVEFSCLPWSGFKNRNSFIANDYAPASEAMANGRYDHAYANNAHKEGKYFTAYLPFDVDTYYFGPEATVYSLSSENTFVRTEQDGELTLKASTKYDLDSKFKFETLVPFLVKSKYKDDIIQATMDQFKERQVEVTYSSEGAKSATIPCYVSNKDEIINPNMGNYYVVDNGCLKKVNGDYTLTALSVAFNASEYDKLHFIDNNTGEFLMPDKTQITPSPDLMGYVTFYSSESCFIVENAEVYTVSQFDNEGHTTLKLDRISDNIVNQGQGVLIKYEPGMTLDMQMVTSPSTCTEAYDNNVLKGVDADTPVVDLNNVYVLSKVENVVGFFPYAGAVSLNGEDVIPANHAYISSDDVNPGALPGVVDFDAVTVIDGLNVDSKQSPIYDLSGRRVFNIKKGDIFIKDGKINIKK